MEAKKRVLCRSQQPQINQSLGEAVCVWLGLVVSIMAVAVMDIGHWNEKWAASRWRRQESKSRCGKGKDPHRNWLNLQIEIILHD